MIFIELLILSVACLRKYYLLIIFSTLTGDALYAIVSRPWSERRFPVGLLYGEWISIKGLGVNKRNLYVLKSRWQVLLCLYAVIMLVFSASITQAAEKYPSSKGTAVNDFARVMDPEKAAKTEALAHEILQKTGAAIVVVTLPELGPMEEINLYTTGLYKAWGIGKKGEDKGVLILLAVKERKIRIETGYGVEGVLTDGIVGQILDRFVIPHLKAGDAGKGLYNAVYSCGILLAGAAGVKLSEGTYPYRPKSQPKNTGFNLVGLILILIAAGVLLGTKQGRQILPWILLMLVSGSGRSSGGGGSFGGGFGGFGGGMSGGGGAGRDF